jgi:hypothetical protein
VSYTPKPGVFLQLEAEDSKYLGIRKSITPVSKDMAPHDTATVTDAAFVCM